MIYVTGDFHGNVRELLSRFYKLQPGEGDIIVVLGDAGLNYYGNHRGDLKSKKLLPRGGAEYFCIHGNHEMRPASIPTYHEEEWHGGKVYVEEAFPNIIFGILYDNETESKKLIDEAFTLTPRAIEEKKFLLEYNHCNISAFLNLGCGIPGETYQHFMKGFEALDQERPCDNGLTFKDVTSIEYETSRKGTAMQMRFICQPCDSRYRIVGFAAIENKDGKVRTNKGWEMTPPFEIG